MKDFVCLFKMITKSQCRHAGPQEQPEPGILQKKTFQSILDNSPHSEKCHKDPYLSNIYPSFIKHLSNIYPTNLAKTPHKRSVDSHQLLSVHPVRLVQNYPDLVVESARNIDLNVPTPRSPSERFDSPAQLVADVKLVRVEEEDDEVDARGKPLEHLHVVVASDGDNEGEMGMG